MSSKNGRHTAFISGAGKNIGREVALALARQGMNIVVNGRGDSAACDAVVADVKALGADAVALMGDVGSAAEVKRMADEALACFGRVDVLVHNAAIRPSKPLIEMSDQDWHRVLDTNLNAAFYLARAFAPGMIEGGWGRIVNFTGMNAMHGYAGRAPVSASKHGQWGLTKALAKELGPKGITVNAISPGPIATARESEAEAQHIQSQAARVPLGRLGKPEEIAALCAFLCSDGGGFVNGQMIAANGGAET